MFDARSTASQYTWQPLIFLTQIFAMLDMRATARALRPRTLTRALQVQAKDERRMIYITVNYELFSDYT